MDPDVPLTPEAQDFMDRITPQIRAGLSEVERVPVSVLLWGPAIDGANPMAPVRLQLRARLRSQGHLAVTNEEIADSSATVSLRVQEFLCARSFDLVVCIPASAGAIGEAHDFASHPLVQSKMVIFVDRTHIGGYSEQSLVNLSTVVSSQVEYYDGPGDASVIHDVTLAQVQRMREMKFMYAWRAV